MTQEPWNDEIYESEEKSRRSRTEKGNKANAIFTILAILFAILVIGMTAFAIYLSNGGSKTNSTEEFYNDSKASSEVTSVPVTTMAQEQPPQTTVSQTEMTEAPATQVSTEAATGETIVVQPGEGVGAIAARAGISIADLERLNPDKMTTGSWLAHPGDVVRIK